jgi:hypothetical protein
MENPALQPLEVFSRTIEDLQKKTLVELRNICRLEGKRGHSRYTTAKPSASEENRFNTISTLIFFLNKIRFFFVDKFTLNGGLYKK